MPDYTKTSLQVGAEASPPAEVEAPDAALGSPRGETEPPDVAAAQVQTAAATPLALAS